MTRTAWCRQAHGGVAAGRCLLLALLQLARPDIFGGGTLPRPWLGATITQEMADTKLEAAFDFFKRLGVPYFAFHDVDAMATASTLKEHRQHQKKIEACIRREDGAPRA